MAEAGVSRSDRRGHGSYPSRRAVLRLGLGAGAALATGGVLGGCRPSADGSFRMASVPSVVGPGAWCWFQSPRAAIDAAGVLWIGSTVATAGPQGGDVEVRGIDLATMRTTAHHVLGRGQVDDHTSPSISVVDGSVRVAWAWHAHQDWLQVGTLGGPLTTVHRPDSMTYPGRGVAYTSQHEVAGAHWMLYRGEEFGWNLLTSTDGIVWSPRGLLFAPPMTPTSFGPGGQRPYLNATSDGRRLHVVVSSGNPGEYRGCDVGYVSIDPDLTIRDSARRAIGTVGTKPARPADSTRLFRGVAGTTGEDSDVDGWMCDVAMVGGQPSALLTVRRPWPAMAVVGRWQHEFRWARRRAGGAFSVEHLGWAGSELGRGAPDYTGLAALDPTDPDRVVVSTNVHPKAGTPLVSRTDGRVHWELWEAYRRGPGNWSWAALTSHSRADNLRPIITVGAGRKTLAWMRGTYDHWTNAQTEVVVRVV